MFLENALERLRKSSRYRELRVIEACRGKHVFLGDRRCVQFCSNDVLGLSEHEEVVRAAMNAVREHGAGGRAARLVMGNTRQQEDLEGVLMDWKGMESVLLFSSGMMANMGLLPVLGKVLVEGERDVFFIFDERVHASLIDGVRLTGKKWCRFRHNDLADLERRLYSYASYKKVVLTESVFSMDGSMPDLAGTYDLCRDHGTMMVVDEAHATGLFGEEGEGCMKAFLEQKREDLVVVGTFGKALGNFGAYVGGPKALRDVLINHARTFVYTTALPPSVIGGVRAAIDLVRKNPSWGKKVLSLSRYFQDWCRSLGISIIRSPSQITGVMTGEDQATLSLSTFLEEHGFYAVGIRPPTVSRGKGRVRLVFNVFHTKADVEGLVSCIKSFFESREPKNG